MSKPNINIPTAFAINGDKTDFPQAKITNGFDRLQPDVLPGDNLNKFIDDTYKGLNGVLELYEGCVLYDSTVTYTNKSLVFDITNDGIKFYHSLQNGNINHALTDADYWEEVNLGGSSRNVGEIISSTLPLTDAGLHLLDGTLLPYGVYGEFIDYIADLYAENPSANYFTTEALWQQSVTTYGVCGKFVYDSVNNTVRLPKITGIIEGTTDLTALGDLVQAGLPNITGGFFTYGAQNVYGAFQTSGGGNGAGGGSYYREQTYTFDASRSSAIYGGSSTVQPQTIKILYYIVIASSSKTEIQVDIDEVSTDLGAKADVDLSNASPAQSFKNASIAWGIPDYTAGVEVTLTTTEQTYTCPSDGVVVMDAAAYNNDWCYLVINSASMFSKTSNSNGWIIGASGTFFVKKNDNCRFKSGYTGSFASVNKFTFYPMKGVN